MAYSPPEAPAAAEARAAAARLTRLHIPGAEQLLLLLTLITSAELLLLLLTLTTGAALLLLLLLLLLPKLRLV
jgi:hypothetical protein